MTWPDRINPDRGCQATTAFARMKVVMDSYYRAIPGLQFIDNPRGADYFRQQQGSSPGSRP